MNKPLPPDKLRSLHTKMAAYNLLLEREKQSQRGGLIEFVRYFWDVLEPETPFVEGWPMIAICYHLEAIAFGDINRLLMVVPPGFAKSILTDCFFPAWMWSALDMPSKRVVAFSYSASLTERDNERFRALIMSDKFQELWGDKFKLEKIGESKVSNNKTGWKRATSVGGVGTGERGNLVILDDPHSIKQVESDGVREETVRWFREAMSNRLNDMQADSIVIIMQRSHDADVAGVIFSENLPYVVLSIEMEFDSTRETAGVPNEIGWVDPREVEGELAWPQRFSKAVCDTLRSTIGPFAWASQYQQNPVPRGGGILKREWWKPWDNEEAQLYGLEWQGARKEFPRFELVFASVDTAYGEREENAYSAMTVWGVFLDRARNRRLMLSYAWKKRVPLHGVLVDRQPGESEVNWRERQKQAWGLVEWIADTCRRYKVQRLLIEDKTRGHDLAAEIARLYARENWGVELLPVSGDKVSRAHSVVPIFADGGVYSPDTKWAEMVMMDCQRFPKGADKDIVDTCTQALNWARTRGLIERADETSAALEEEAAYHHPQQTVAQQYGV